jgi:hypothetical protein
MTQKINTSWNLTKIQSTTNAYPVSPSFPRSKYFSATTPSTDPATYAKGVKSSHEGWTFMVRKQCWILIHYIEWTLWEHLKANQRTRTASHSLRVLSLDMMRHFSRNHDYRKSFAKQQQRFSMLINMVILWKSLYFPGKKSKKDLLTASKY